MRIVLASSSPYRQALLSKLQLPFSTFSPNIDENALPDELPNVLAQRLAINKAKAVAEQVEADLIIGSDQVASLEGKLLGKPIIHNNAVEQLSASSGKTMDFYTGLCLYNVNTQTFLSCVEPYQVKFRTLTNKQIENYLTLEQPYDCAGSFKCEGLGISLFEFIRGDDPNSLVGLPLIRLVSLFNQMGLDLYDLIQTG